MFSYQSSSSAVERSYTSARSRSSGPKPASAYAPCAIASRNVTGLSGAAAAESVVKFGISITVFGYDGVTVEIAAIRTGPAAPRRCAYSRLDTTTAAAPSLVAQMSSRRSGSATTGDAMTSSSVTALRYRAFGFESPCAAFLTFTLAKSAGVAPNSSMRRRA